MKLFIFAILIKNFGNNNTKQGGNYGNVFGENRGHYKKMAGG